MAVSTPGASERASSPLGQQALAPLRRRPAAVTTRRRAPSPPPPRAASAMGATRTTSPSARSALRTRGRDASERASVHASLGVAPLASSSSSHKATPRLPPHKELACNVGCCWRHLSTMLLQEVHILRRFEAENRDALLEQKRIIESLAANTDQLAIEGLREERDKLREEHKNLEVECPILKRENEQYRADAEADEDSLTQFEADVRALAERFTVQNDRRNSLQARLREAEAEIALLSAQQEPLATELGNGQIRNSGQKNGLDLVEAACFDYERQLANLSAKPKKKKKPSKKG